MGATQYGWQGGTGSITGKEGVEALQSQQRMFLLRLRRLIWLRKSCSGQLDDSVLKVLDKSIYSTYIDCIEQGVGEDAKQLLRQAP